MASLYFRTLTQPEAGVASDQTHTFNFPMGGGQTLSLALATVVLEDARQVTEPPAVAAVVC